MHAAAMERLTEDTSLSRLTIFNAEVFKKLSQIRFIVFLRKTTTWKAKAIQYRAFT